MKKLFGYIFFVAGVLLSLVLLLYFASKLPLILSTVTSPARENHVGFIVGIVIFFGLMVSITAALIIGGLRWIRGESKRSTPHDILDQ